MPIPDNSLTARYIRKIENPDSVGYKDKYWYKSTRKGDDPNNRGFGIDIKYNKDASAIAGRRDGKWLTEEEERNLRQKHIGYTQEILEKWTPKMLKQPISEKKVAMASGLLYRGDGIKTILKNPTLRDTFYAGSDEDFQKALSDYYNSKGLSERVKNHNAFMSSAEEEAAAKFENTEKFTPTNSLFSEGGKLNTSWDNLSVSDKSEMIKVAISNGITTLPEIKDAYNKFAEGGPEDNIFESDKVLGRANKVYTNYDEATDFNMNSFIYDIKNYLYQNNLPSSLSNCTLTATQWIDPNNPIKSASTIVSDPLSNGYTKIGKEDIVPGNLMISRNPKTGSFHTMLIESINPDGTPNLRYSTGGPDNDSLRYNVSQKEYHKRDNSQGGNHTEDMFFRYNYPNEYWLPGITVTAPKKHSLGGNFFGDGGIENSIALYDSLSTEALDRLKWRYSKLPFRWEAVPNDTDKSYIVDNLIAGKKHYLHFDAGTLPEVNITANIQNKNPRRYIELNTYYPIISEFPYTGHSELYRNNGNTIEFPTTIEYKGNEENGIFNISKNGSDSTYNFITNNCSDATRRALELIYNTKLDSAFFTTPGDVYDFAKDHNGIVLKNNQTVYSGPLYVDDEIYSSDADDYSIKGTSRLAIPTDQKTLELLQKNKKYINTGNNKDRVFSLGGNLYACGDWKPSKEAINRLYRHEGISMTQSYKDPLSGKWVGPNNSVDNEAKAFVSAIPESIRYEVLLNPELADNLFSYSYNVGAGNFRGRVVPVLKRYFKGECTIEDITNSMWASGDKKLKGLQKRRAEERQGVRNALLANNNSINNPLSSSPLYDESIFSYKAPVINETMFASTPKVEEVVYDPMQEKRENLQRFASVMAMMNNGEEDSPYLNALNMASNPLMTIANINS